MLYYQRGSKEDHITQEEAREALWSVFQKIGPRHRVLALPPDITRLNSYAGTLTRMAWAYYGEHLTDIMPALGTHAPMTAEQIRTMFGDIPLELFRVHDWRHDVVTLGQVPSEVLSKVSEGKIRESWPAQVNRMVMDPGYDLILSIGQVVPHEVIGMANHSKNLFVGVGGAEGINLSHFLGATYGMERIMGRAMTPVRYILEYARKHFLAQRPILFIQTVLSKDENGQMVLRGLFIGDGYECFEKAAALSLECNFIMVDRPIEKCLVYLDPEEFRSTWLGNKAIYRTRMALGDGAELLILAPGLRTFGEDRAMDALIRKYGYRGSAATLEATERNSDLRANLGGAAHLIHGSSEGRFRITYAPSDGMTRQEIEGVGFAWTSLEEAMRRYPIEKLRDGWNTLEDGEEIYYISNPALGLWAHRDRFKD